VYSVYGVQYEWMELLHTQVSSCEKYYTLSLIDCYFYRFVVLTVCTGVLQVRAYCVAVRLEENMFRLLLHLPILAKYAGPRRSELKYLNLLLPLTPSTFIDLS
jgi:hypothetical protein